MPGLQGYVNNMIYLLVYDNIWTHPSRAAYSVIISAEKWEA